jgi:DNA-binding CsgD family transcriptional regulator
VTSTDAWWRSTKRAAAVYGEIDRLSDLGTTQAQIVALTGVSESTVRRRQQARRGHARSTIGKPLSAQQARVLARMADQDEPSTQRAADDLGISRSAVEQSLYRAYARLGVHTLLGAYRVYVVEQDRRLPNWRH